MIIHCFLKSQQEELQLLRSMIDNLLITGDDPTEQETLKFFLHSEFQIKDLGDAHYFLGFKVVRETQVSF